MDMPSVGPVAATVIVPTRDRPADLRRCLEALACQTGAPPFEVIVVDDGSLVPVAPLVEELGPRFRTLRRDGDGPARARNAGAADAAAVLLFTDDDTEPAACWVAAACAHLEQHPDDLGVEGPVFTPAWDPLTSYSVHSHGPGAYLTCNVAYRRDAFLTAAGFYPGFPSASGEDHDLAFRLLRQGRIGYAPGMEVVHHPRALSFWGVVRRGLNAETDILLYERHPERFPARAYPFWLRSLYYDAKRWFHHARSAEHGIHGDVKRGARMAVTATVYLGCTATGTARGMRARRRRLRQP